MTSTGNKIDDPRGKIDAIDAELLRLLNARAAIALRVGAAKAGAKSPLCDPGREQEVWDFYRNNPDALASLRAPIFEDKVIDYILELAKITDKTVSREELYQEDEA